MARTVLFVCTGNYYRSRFAEAVFTQRADASGLDWRATSRGLWVGDNPNAGPISEFARRALEARGVPFREDQRPARLTQEDLQAADRTIVLDEEEHRPMMAARFRDWMDAVEYWRVHDLHLTPPADALPAIERAVDGLLAELRARTA